MLLEIQINCKKIGFGRKNQLSSQCVHIVECFFKNSENVKNRKCVQTWGNGTGYTSGKKKGDFQAHINKIKYKLICFLSHFISFLCNFWFSYNFSVLLSNVSCYM